MTYDQWKSDAPDPGTVEDERCTFCGESYQGRCGCPQAQEATLDRAALLELDVDPALELWRE
jgi:hypothetical protein